MQPHRDRMRKGSLLRRRDLARAAGVSTALCLVLAFRVYVSFGAVRVKVVEAPIAARDGQVHVVADADAANQLTAPFAVIARIRHTSPAREAFEIQIDGRAVCNPRVRPGAVRRVDCASPDEGNARAHQVTVRGPTSPWTLEYLELATHHGSTRAHDLLIVPAVSGNYARPSAGWIAFAWMSLAAILLVPFPAHVPRGIGALYKIAAVVVAGFLAAVALSSFVSPYSILLSPRGFVRAAGVLLAPRVWVLGVRLVAWWRGGERAADASPRLSPLVVVLIVSGALGFRLGLVGFPTWQVAVETAQVVAGLVDYPPGNPFYIYHTELWTGLHHVLALLLLAGVSEITLSMITSGVLGMLSFQALSIVVYAFGRDALLAVASAFLVFYTGAAEAGVMYPITLMGTTHTYGTLGLSWVVLVAGLLGANRRRSGSFLLGLAPAVHPSIGLWFALIVGLAVAWERWRSRAALAVSIPYVVAGGAFTLVSLAVQHAVIRDVSPIGVEAGRYLTAFVGFWDGHRAPVGFANAGVALNGAALVLALLWLNAFVSTVPPAAALLLRIIVVSAGLSLALAVVSWIPPARLPAALLVLMPGRMLNFNAMAFPALLIGLVGAYRRTAWSGWLVLSLTMALLINGRSRLWVWSGESLLARLVPEGRMDMLIVLGLASIALVAGARLYADTAQDRRAALARAGALAIMGWTAIQTWSVSVRPSEIFSDRTNDTVFSAAAGQPGLLATAGDLHLVQLRTRRPVLLDGGGLDGLPYAIEGGPEMARILRDVYAIDFFDPPPEARGSGAIPRVVTQTVWEQYSLEKWLHIARTYGVTHVLAYADWKLALPVAARDPVHVLYRIPLRE